MRSPTFWADAWHHRSDAFSSVGALVGALGSMLGFVWFDALAGVVISFFVLKTAWAVLRSAGAGLMDCSVGDALEQRLLDHVAGLPGVGSVDCLRTRLAGSRVFVELEVGIAASCTFSAAHAISEHVHASLEKTFPEIKHVAVHANPIGPQIS